MIETNSMERSKEMQAKMQSFTDAGLYEQDNFIDFEPEGHIYTYKGEALRLSGKFDEAVEGYKKAFELDPTYIAAAYQAGVSLNSKAIELKDQLADKKTGKLTVENANKIKAILTDAKTYLEKVRELDPDRSQVNWAYALYQMYYSLGDNEKANELEKLLGQ